MAVLARVMELADMADSKSAGRRAVWVRVPLRVQGGSSPGMEGHYQPTSRCFCGGRAGWISSVVNAPVWVAVAKSPTSVCEGVLWGRAARVVSCVCVCLVSPFVGAARFFWGVWLVLME